MSRASDRILFVKNLPFDADTKSVFDLFGRFGPLRQVRLGNAGETKGTAFVVYEDAVDARTACDKLAGFNFKGRYLVALFHQPDKTAATHSIEARQQALDETKRKYGMD